MQRLTPNQRRCLERLADFPFAAADDGAFARRGRWRASLGMSDAASLVVDLGCADGALLARVASRCPNAAFVGVDWKYDDALLAAERIATAGLTNVAIARGRAADLRRLFADGELDELWLFHPEPCDSPRERPNRLIADRFLADAAAVLRGGGTLSIKTDHAGTFRATLALFDLPEPTWPESARLRDVDPLDAATPPSDARHAFDVAFLSADFWNDAAAQSHVADRAFTGEQSTYERRFVEKRRPIFYVELRRRA